MSAREDILGAVRGNEPKGDYPLPEVITFPQDDGGDLVAYFVAHVHEMGGALMELGDSTLAEAIRATWPEASVIASAVPDVEGNRDLHQVTEQRDLHDVDVAVVRARLGVGESGSVLFAEQDLVVNSVAYLAQHLVVLLDPADIVPGLQEAYLRPDFQEHPYLVFHSGPSATADIEGVLIHGAQGVRSLHVVLQPRS